VLLVCFPSLSEVGHGGQCLGGKIDYQCGQPLYSGATTILISCHPTLAAPHCLQYHAVLGAIKGYILRRQTRSHTWTFELHCDMVDIDRVGDINILAIIVFAPEVDNGAPGSIDRHYKGGHIIAALDANVAIDYLRDIYVHLASLG